MNDLRKIADRLTNEFNLSNITFHNESPSNTYIRYGYWKPLPPEILGKFPELTQNYDYDEDCGDLFCYILVSRW
jgi:hypothetical protein